MTKPQICFGIAVGALLTALGSALVTAGITGAALAATGLLVLLVNTAYWVLGRRGNIVPVEASDRSAPLGRIQQQAS